LEQRASLVPFIPLAQGKGLLKELLGAMSSVVGLCRRRFLGRWIGARRASKQPYREGRREGGQRWDERLSHRSRGLGLPFFAAVRGVLSPRRDAGTAGLGGRGRHRRGALRGRCRGRRGRARRGGLGGRRGGGLRGRARLGGGRRRGSRRRARRGGAELLA